MEIEFRRKPAVAVTSKEGKEPEQKKDLHLDDFDLADSDREDYHNNVDILFVLDTTGSMGSYFSPAIETIKKIVEKFNKMEFNIKFSLCAYRDHPPQESSYVTEFTDLTTPKQLVEVLARLSASGGGDGPEAVMDGLREGLSKSTWRLGEDGTTVSKRFLFHICDAPPHGQEYGGSSSDAKWQQNGCPCGTKKEDINNLLKQHKVDYHLIKAVSSVDKMEEVFKSCFGENYAETINLDQPSGNYASEECEEAGYDECDDVDDDCDEDEYTAPTGECKKECDDDLFGCTTTAEKEEVAEKKCSRKMMKPTAASTSIKSDRKEMWEGVISALDKKLI